MRRFFEPNEVFGFTDLSPDRLRDWRRRKLLEGIGTEQPNGRWLYSPGDVGALACAKWLEATRLVGDLEVAIAIARHALPAIWDFISFSDSPPRYPRYLAVPLGASEHDFRWFPDYPQIEIAAALVLDLKRIADELRKTLGLMIVQVEADWREGA